MKSLMRLFITAILMTLVTAANAQKKYSFRGKLGSDIAFRLDIEQNKDGILAGETTYYRKDGQISKIPVYGWLQGADKQGYWNGNALILTEYTDKKECGRFMIALSAKNEVVEGSWNGNEKEYSINSVEKTTFPAGVTYFHPAKTSAINGEYSYQSDNEHGGTCTLKYTNKKVRYHISVVNPNIAETVSTATLNGSYFSAHKGAYKFKVYIDRKFLCIWTTQQAEVDDWGAFTTLDGFYFKK